MACTPSRVASLKYGSRWPDATCAAAAVPGSIPVSPVGAQTLRADVTTWAYADVPNRAESGGTHPSGICPW